MVFNLFSENNTKVPEIRRSYPFMVSNDFESMFSQDCSPADAPKVHCKNGHIIIIPGGMKGNVSGLEWPVASVYDCDPELLIDLLDYLYRIESQACNVIVDEYREVVGSLKRLIREYR